MMKFLTTLAVFLCSVLVVTATPFVEVVADSDPLHDVNVAGAGKAPKHVRTDLVPHDNLNVSIIAQPNMIQPVQVPDVQLVFEMGITEYCQDKGSTMVKATLDLSAIQTDLYFTKNRVHRFAVNHVGLNIGPYDFETGELNFRYGPCNWNLNEVAKQECGRCWITEDWSNPQPNCGRKSD